MKLQAPAEEDQNVQKPLDPRIFWSMNLRLLVGCGILRVSTVYDLVL